MYTRGPSIANIFQKAVLLKDTKCNKIIQRQLCSESLIKFSKIDKLMPMKRYYSGASNNRNPNQKSRSIQGVGYIRKALPKYPREMAQQPLSMNEQMAPSYIQHKGVIASDNLGTPLNGQYVNENPLSISGKITIVLDKNEICGCSAPNENVQIFVTTSPETTQTIRQADISKICEAKCNCCPQCQEVKNFGTRNMVAQRSIVAPFQQPSSVSNFSNQYPKSHQSVNGSALPRYVPNPYARFNILDERRSLNLKKSHSMSDFPAMRKLIVPSNETQPQARQLHRPPASRTHSLSGANNFGRFNNSHPPSFQRLVGPNPIQMQRIQQTNETDIVFPRPNEHMRSHRADFPKKDQHTKRMDELKKLARKYSSFHHQDIPSVQPENVPMNPPDAKQNKQPRDKVEIGSGGPKTEKPVPKSRFIVERVIRPASFSSVGRVISNGTGNIASALNQIAIGQKIKSLHGPTTAKSSSGALISKPNLVNLRQEIVTKNRFPAEREGAPRMLTFKNQNKFDGARRSDNVSKIVGRFGLRQRVISPGTGPMIHDTQAKNKFPLQPLSIPPKQRSTESINLKQFSVRRQPQLVVQKNRSKMRPSFNLNYQIRKQHPQNVSHQQKSNRKIHRRQLAPMRTNHMSRMGQTKQPPKFILRRSAPMSANHMNRMGQRKQPPVFRMRKCLPVMAARGRKNRQPDRRTFIPTLQKGSLQTNVNSKQNRPKKGDAKSVTNFWSTTRPSYTSMIPVRSRISPENAAFNAISNTEVKRQRKPVEPQRPRYNPARRVKRDELQKSLPVDVAKKTNQIETNVDKPRSVETAVQPYQRRMNPLRLQQMPTKTDEQKPIPSKSLEMASPSADKSSLKGENPAVLFYAPGKLQLVDVPMPRLIDETGVIVKMLYVHLTDTDAQILSAEQNGPYKLSQPTIAGKSGSGVIVDVGQKVDNVKIGDKVSVKGHSCGKCSACQSDNAVICERVPMIEKLGILKRFHALPAKFVTKLPDSVHPIDGAMIDELSSAIRACKKSTVTAGDNVLVLGGKSLGLWTALAAKRMGATNVCLADARPLVLDQAKKLGIERVFLIDAESPIPNIVNSVTKHMEGENPRIVFDCTGSSLTNSIAINTSAVGGKVVFMRNAISNQPMFLANAVDRGVDILSSQHGNNESERAAIQFLSSGKVQLKGIDSSFFEITNVREAFGLLNSGTTANIFIQPSRLNDESEGKK
ncbi:uncharacterized protein LOC119074999 [Bradysia coprophila]|uniref:uncharacterized protein LOC119074999 n=1 Tax=Bradysia coprophila TaxID=38358 RepID=UPI00187DBF6D|nr:uncharacterized protein LOC119074999 [Bradysia coprophila]